MKLVCFLLLEIANIIKSSESIPIDDCSDINSKTNTIFNQQLTGDLMFKTDLKYELDHLQWASPISDNISPEMILIPGCDNDIQLMIKYASECGYKVMTRSGGHQYR